MATTKLSKLKRNIKNYFNDKENTLAFVKELKELGIKIDEDFAEKVFENKRDFLDLMSLSELGFLKKILTITRKLKWQHQD